MEKVFCDFHIAAGLIDEIISEAVGNNRSGRRFDVISMIVHENDKTEERFSC